MTVQEQEHWICLPDGTRIHGMSKIVPQKQTEGTLVLCHGRLDHMNKGPLYRILDKLPFNTFRFSARGMGLSEGETGYSNAEIEAKDLGHILEYVRDNIDNNIIGLAGHSQGSCVCCLYVANPKRPVEVPLLINISGRYSSEGTENRLAPRITQEIEQNGRAVWLNYRRGPNWEKSPYVITKEALESHRKRVLTCVEQFPESLNVLVIHGKEDGTVLPSNALAIDQGIKKSDACSDLILAQGASHNWDNEQDEEVLSSFIVTWIKARKGVRVTKTKGDLVDHLARSS